jgi:hypothetical protein
MQTQRERRDLAEWMGPECWSNEGNPSQGNPARRERAEGVGPGCAGRIPLWDKNRLERNPSEGNPATRERAEGVGPMWGRTPLWEMKQIGKKP